MTWSSLAGEGQRALEAAGWPHGDARRDTVLLARHVLGWDAGQWLTGSRGEADQASADQFHALVARRARHEPLAYITGAREFYGRSFLVTPDVLIPRPETELIVEEALQILGPGPRAQGPGPNIIDVGTGSGCLAITLALEFPTAGIVATDISAAALAIARTNAVRLGAQDRIEFQHASLLGAHAGPFDLIVANLPYVAERDRHLLPREVADFEPAAALFGGPDGLDVFRALLPVAAGALSAGGWLILEIGQGQLNDVRELVDGTKGLVFRHAGQDLQGIPRVVVAATSQKPKARSQK